VRVLRIKYNQLARLPSTVTRLPQLVTLELSGNQITRLDSSIGKVSSRAWGHCQHGSRCMGVPC
jgi:Leucine-rich repeat (LRR) protein